MFQKTYGKKKNEGKIKIKIQQIYMQNTEKIIKEIKAEEIGGE